MLWLPIMPGEFLQAQWAVLLQLPGACAAPREELSSLLLPRLGEGAGLDPLSQAHSVPKGWPHFPEGYKCKRRNGEHNLSSNHGMQRKQEPDMVKAAWARTLLTMSWGPAPFPAGFVQMALHSYCPMELDSSFCPDATPSSQATASKWCQWCRLPSFLPNLALSHVFVTEQQQLHC